MSVGYWEKVGETVARRRTRLADWIVGRPIIDHAAPLALLVAWVTWLSQYTPAASGTRLAFYGGVATLSGLVLAAATFVCTMTYQSSSHHLEHARRRFATELKRNWTAIIVSTLLASVAAVMAFVIDGASSSLAMIVALYSLALVTVRFGRSVWWLRYTLFMQQMSDVGPTPIVVDLPKRHAS